MIRALLYIAASYSKDRIRAQQFIERCRLAGFGISHDWTNEMPPPPHMTESDGRYLTRQQAQDDLTGAIEARVLVLLSSDVMRGAWVEMGAALASGNRVLIVGEVKGEMIFLALPQVHHVATEDEALAWLEKEY